MCFFLSFFHSFFHLSLSFLQQTSEWKVYMQICAKCEGLRRMKLLKLCEIVEWRESGLIRGKIYLSAHPPYPIRKKCEKWKENIWYIRLLCKSLHQLKKKQKYKEILLVAGEKRE